MDPVLDGGSTPPISTLFYLIVSTLKREKELKARESLHSCFKSKTNKQKKINPMKKVTLTIELLIEETPDNLESLSELKLSVDSGEFSKEFVENSDGIEVSTSLTIEDV